jgi:hypothetical protein
VFLTLTCHPHACLDSVEFLLLSSFFGLFSIFPFFLLLIQITWIASPGEKEKKKTQVENTEASCPVMDNQEHWALTMPIVGCFGEASRE